MVNRKLKCGLIAAFSAVILLSGCAAKQASNSSLTGEVDVETTEQTTAENNVGKGSATVAQTEEESSNFDAESIISNIGVTGYTYSSSYSNYLVLVLNNKSEYDCELEISIDFYDGDDKIVGTESCTVDAFAGGTETAVEVNCADSFSKYEYTLKAYELDYYVCVNQNLKCEVSTATDKAIIKVTNTGDIAAEFVSYYALFFKGEKLVYVNWGYVIDNDSEIKPGDTQSAESSCYESFDSVKVYLDGRGLK